MLLWGSAHREVGRLITRIEGEDNREKDHERDNSDKENKRRDNREGVTEGEINT
jgi:hypothetical protein